MNWNPKKALMLFASLLASLCFILQQRQTPKAFRSNFDSIRGNMFFPDVSPEEDNHLWLHGKEEENLLGGLLPEGLDVKSCRSRYQSGWRTKRKPSHHLISKLRGYEVLHKRCAPGSDGYKRALARLISGFSDEHGCKYVVWMPRDGLGNRIMSLVSTFLYALLTNRVILVHNPTDLFCEPFPQGSWLVPEDLPLVDSFANLDKLSNMSYGNMVKTGNGTSLIQKHGWVYLHLVHDYNHDDQKLFCSDYNQVVLQDVPWHVLQSNLYFAPSLFLMPSHQKELDRLFPEKDAVFHFLGRYLLHPSNSVWRTITKYYNHFLAKANERIGIQVRIFNPNPDPFARYMDQILSCVFKENILPLPLTSSSTRQVNPTGESPGQLKAVLVTSLSARYYDTLKQMYKDNMTVAREFVRFFQPTHENEEHSEQEIHNMKAWAEMYLLSLMDKLVTSSKSTFGYVAQSLGGLRPWILYRPEEYSGVDPNLSCQRAISMEPCFHAASSYDCSTRNRADLGRIVPHVRSCEDVPWTWGLKLFGENEDS